MSEIPNFARRYVQIIELDLDTCGNTYGSAPCTAAGGTGNECYNTFKTCQDKANFNRQTKTYKFCSRNMNLPAAETYLPYVSSVKTSPTELDVDNGLGRRSTSSVTMIDEPHNDAGVDPYRATRAAAPQSTYWSRLLARNPNYSGRVARVRRAYLSGAFSIGDFVTEQYIIDKIEGPNARDGSVNITLKDPIKLADRVKVPVPTGGKVAVLFGTNDLQIYMRNGDGDAYPNSGYIRTAKEVVRYTHKRVAFGWNFDDNSTDGWTATNGTITGGATVATFEATGSGADIRIESGVAFSGGVFRYVRARIRRIQTGAWEGKLYYKTEAHGFSESYYKQISEPANLSLGDWVDVTFDMHQLDAGGVDWSQNTITGLRLDLVSGAAGEFEIDWIGEGAAPDFSADVLAWPDGTYRGLFNTTPTAVKIGEQVQLCKVYVDQPLTTVMIDLLNESGIESGSIDTTLFASQQSEWFGTRFNVTACISDPEDASNLLQELCKQSNSVMWWDATTQKVALRVVGPRSPTDVLQSSLTDDTEIIESSRTIKALDDKRLNFVAINYDIESAVADKKQPSSYKRGEVFVDADASGANEYDDVRTEVQFSRWFTSANESAMRATAARRLAYYRDAPKEIGVQIDAKDAGIQTGDLVDVSCDGVVKVDGSIDTKRCIVTKHTHELNGRISLTLRTTVFARKYAFIGPASMPDYGSASDAQRAYAFICNSAGKMGNGDDGYIII